MLSDEGTRNLQLLKEMILNKWEKRITWTSETVKSIPIDAFELQMQIDESTKILLEYETGTFALKLWTGKEFEYIDDLSGERIVYGFESMNPDNIRHNLEVLDRIMSVFKV